MFDHLFSEMCYFGKKCSNNLCPYKHEPEVIETVDTLEKDLNDKYDNLADNEQCQSRKILCDKLCKPSPDCHRCSNKVHEEDVGGDAFNNTDEFDDDWNKNELFPCEECDEVFT